MSKEQATENDGKSLAIRFCEQPVIGIGDKRSVHATDHIARMGPTCTRASPLLSAVALAWYGVGELFDNDLDSTGSLVED